MCPSSFISIFDGVIAEKMKYVRVLLSIILGFAFSALVAEAVLRLLPVSMGLYRTKNHDAWPLYAYGPHQSFTYSLTWQMLYPNRGTTNNYGHIAPFDFLRGSRPVLVIGDSFIEAMMNRYEDTLQGELGRLLEHKVPVYGLGFAGNSLAEYLAVARMAKAEFSPEAMVFMIVDNDIKESFLGRVGHRFFEIDGARVREAYLPLNSISNAQRIREVAGDSALYRYVQVNLGFSLAGVVERRMPTAVAQPQDSSQKDEAPSRKAVDYFLKSLPEASGIPPERLVLVFDADREKLYDPTRHGRRGPDSAAMQTYLARQAEKLGFATIDMKLVFSEEYKKNKQKFDYTPVDRHWNGLGHRLAAEEVARWYGALRQRNQAADDPGY